MARIKQRITLPGGETVWCTGNSIGDLISNLLARFPVTTATMKKEAPTLKAFIDTEFQPFIDGLADTTRATYESYIKYFILPFMGNMRMDDISVDIIQRFYNWMALERKPTVNRKTIERVGGFTSRIFRVAKAKHYIEETPFQKVLLNNKGKEAGHHKPLPDAEVDRIKKAIPTLADERQRLYMALLAYTGMRREEILGMRWEYINLQDGYGTVKNVVVYSNNAETIVKDSPKTKSSMRIFNIPTALKQILEPCQRENGFVIHGRTPEEPACYSTAQRTYRAAFKALGIWGAFNNHDWRATFARQLKDAGLSSAQGADLMGHADTRMYDTVYAPARKESIIKHKDTLEKLNQVYTL